MFLIGIPLLVKYSISFSQVLSLDWLYVLVLSNSYCLGGVIHALKASIKLSGTIFFIISTPLDGGRGVDKPVCNGSRWSLGRSLGHTPTPPQPELRSMCNGHTSRANRGYQA